MPLSTTGWHADRALGATEWYGRAPQARRPGAIAIATAMLARCFCDSLLDHRWHDDTPPLRYDAVDRQHVVGRPRDAWPDATRGEAACHVNGGLTESFATGDVRAAGRGALRELSSVFDRAADWAGWLVPLPLRDVTG